MVDPSTSTHKLTAEVASLKKRIQELEDTERELQITQETLRESTAQYRFLADKMTDFVWIVDMDLQTHYVSPSVEKMFGYTPAEWTRMDVSEKMTPASLSAVYDVLARDLELERQGQADPDRITRIEGEYYHKDGSIRWAESIVSGIRNERGELTGIHGVTRDITDRKQAETEKLELERHLAGAHKFRAMATLAAGVAHDFNNLLTGIQSYVSLMKYSLEPSHPHYEKLKHVEEFVGSGANLTKQLLAFARSGKHGVKSLSINDIIKKTAAMFGRTRKEITIRERYSSDPCVVEADHAQMEQVFMNLYVNAWHAMPDGGSICLETEKVILDNTQAVYNGMTASSYVKITITDTGTGMDGLTKERIFDPFFTTKGMGRGTGLGLATVYGIVKAHGGMIHVDSYPAKGSTFTIHLPVSEKAAAGETVTGESALRGSETILLVDDEITILDASKELLEFLGYRVYAANSGREAIELYGRKKDEIDLIVLDMIMPGLSGRDTFDRLREINPVAKVLLTSGYGVEGEAAKIMDQGCSGFIQKPFPLEKLSRSVRDLLD